MAWSPLESEVELKTWGEKILIESGARFARTRVHVLCFNLFSFNKLGAFNFSGMIRTKINDLGKDSSAPSTSYDPSDLGS